MKFRTIATFCFALLLVLLPAGAWQAQAAHQPSSENMGSLPASPFPARGGIPIPLDGTDYLSIPAPAFEPDERGVNYENHGRYIKVFGEPLIFRAPVLLPHGAKVKRISSCFNDDSPAHQGVVTMYATLLADETDLTIMAQTTSLPGFGYVVDATVTSPVVNNASYTYWLGLYLPVSAGSGDDVWGCGVTIEYYRPAVDMGIVSLPGLAFDNPAEDGYNAGFSQPSSDQLIHRTTPAGSVNGVYLVPVNLPHEAVVNGVSMYYKDTSAVKAIEVYLLRSALGVGEDLVSIGSLDGNNYVTNTNIHLATIDNMKYAYWAYAVMPPSSSATNPDIALWALTIDYTPPAEDEGWMHIPAAGFTGFHDGLDYQNHGRWLFHLHSELGSSADGVYLAPVYLPQGARVNEVYYSFWDGSDIQNGTGYLVNTRLGVNVAMSLRTSHTGTGYVELQDVVIDEPFIDNSRYAYFVYIVLPVSSTSSPPANTDVIGVSIRIGYTKLYAAYLPMVRK